MARTDPLVGNVPNLLGIPDDFEVLPSIFQGSDINQIYYLGIEGEESANAELDDEHVGNAVASPVFTQESEAEASLAQTYHSKEESLWREAQSVSANTEQSVVWPTKINGSRAESWNMKKSRQFCKYKRSNFLGMRDPRS